MAVSEWEICMAKVKNELKDLWVMRGILLGHSTKIWKCGVLGKREVFKGEGFRQWRAGSYAKLDSTSHNELINSSNTTDNRRDQGKNQQKQSNPTLSLWGAAATREC